MKKEKEHCVQRSGYFMNNIIESSPIPIITVDITGKVLLWNKAAEKTFGWKQSEIIGKPNPIIPKDRKEEFEELLTISLKGEDVIDFHTVRKRKNDTNIHVSISVSAWKDENGNIIGGIAQMIDITDKIYAENELIESKKELEIIFNSSGDALFIHDLQGRIKKVNDEACRRLEYSIEELLNLTPSDLDSDKYKPLVKQRISEINKKQSFTFETEHVTKSGAIIPSEIKSTLILINNKKYILSIARDISERKKAEAELKESEKRFRNAVVLSPNPIMIHDEEDNVIQLSKGWTRYSGYTLEDIPTLGDWTEKAYGSRKGIEKEYIDNLFKIKETVNNGEWNVKCKNDEKRIWEFFTTPLGISNKRRRLLLSIAFDITDKKKAVKELKESEEKYREFFKKDLTGDFLSTVDGKMIDCNPAFLKILGYDKVEELSHNSLKSIYKNENDRDKLIRQITETKEVSNYEITLTTKNGNEIHVIENVIGVFDNDGKLTHLRGYIFDITDRKTAEEKSKHLFSILYAIRNINQLIVTEKNIDNLLQQACEILLESREYSATWIGLINDQKKFDKVFHNGFGKRIDNLFEQMKKWNMPPCITLPTLENPIIKSVAVDKYCKDCVMRRVREGKGVIVSLIKHLNNIYGAIYIITEEIEFFTDEEKSLIEEVSGDLGLAIFINKEEEKRKEAELRLQNAIDVIPDVFTIYNQDKQYVYVNKAIMKYGLTPKELVGKKPEAVLPEEIKDKSISLLHKAFVTKQTQSDEISVKINNRHYWFNPRYYPILDKNKNVKEVLSISTDITERKTYEQQFLQLAEGVSSKVGEEFFDVLVEKLSQTLNAEVVLIGEIDKNDPNLINTISIFQFLQHIDNFSYDVKDTPCEGVIGKKLIYYEKGGYEKLSAQHPFAKLKMEGYIGTPLLDSQNNTIGLLVCLFKEPIKNIKIKESIVHVFGLRASAEMERLAFEQGIIKHRDKLRESEEKFRTVVESAFDGIYVMKEAHYEYVNRRFCELTGYTEVELTSPDFDFRKLLTEKSLSIVEERYEARKQGKTIPQTYETEIRSKDGKIKDVEISIVSIGSKAELTILGFVHDITELKLAFRKVRESEIRFRSITQSANDAIVTVDSKGNIIGWNPGAKKIFGFTEEEILNKPITLIIPREYHTEHIGGLKRVAAGGEKHVIGRTVELEGLHKSGNVIPIELSLAEWESSGEKYFTGIIRDITERISSEENIKKLSRGIEQSPASVIITNANGIIEYVNRKFTEITGYSSSEAVGKNPNILKSGINDPSVYKDLWQAIKQSKEWRGELCNKRKDGSLYWDVVSISPIKNADGDIINYIGVQEDITERKELVEELTAAKKRAEAADKIKSEFLAQMSHEIRSPLNAILNFTSLIKEETSDVQTEELEVSFNAIDSASKRIIRSIDLILNMTDLQLGTYSVTKRKVDILDLLNNLLKEYKNIAESKGLQLNLNNTLDKAEINTDDYAVAQIFANLIDNAIKYTHKGFIEIRLHKEDSDKHLVEVEDTGIGISEEYLPELFSPFSQEEHGYSRKFDGTGLGMSLVKKYCELIGAEIKVKSKKDIGTTFTVKLRNNIY